MGEETVSNVRRLSGEQMPQSLAAYIGLLLVSAPAAVFGQAAATQRAASSDPIYLIIRTDDVGMSHSVNMGVQRLVDTGLPVSVSVMFACPWYQEAVEILKRHPDVSVGIHLTLNSEWKYYRWGPVAGREAVPTLVDADGYFFQSSEALYKNHADPKEIEKELRAQIERARRLGGHDHRRAAPGDEQEPAGRVGCAHLSTIHRGFEGPERGAHYISRCDHQARPQGHATTRRMRAPP